MHYKTMILELLRQRHEMHDRLRRDRMLISAMDLYAQELKTSHEAWKERLAQAKPGSDLSQIASEALEMALAEMEARLPSASPQNERASPSLDEAMAYIRSHTSLA